MAGTGCSRGKGKGKGKGGKRGKGKSGASRKSGCQLKGGARTKCLRKAARKARPTRTLSALNVFVQKNFSKNIHTPSGARRELSRLAKLFKSQNS